MLEPVSVRDLCREDHEQWLPLWNGYNAFYGRVGATALAGEISATTWERFFDPAEPVFAVCAVSNEGLAGIAHYLFHRSTTKVEPVCYLQDLFTAPDDRGRGAGRALIEAVYARARAAGARRVYWQTHATNGAARGLYDKVARHLGFIVYSHEPE